MLHASGQKPRVGSGLVGEGGGKGGGGGGLMSLISPTSEDINPTSWVVGVVGVYVGSGQGGRVYVIGLGPTQTKRGRTVT